MQPHFAIPPSRLRAWLLRETYALPLDLFRKYLPLLQAATYLALLVELVIPILLLCRPGHYLKWSGLPPTPFPDIDLSTDLPPDFTILRDHNRARMASTPSSAGGAVNLTAIYARVSSDTQEKDQTIASQLAALWQAAQERGYQGVVRNSPP